MTASSCSFSVLQRPIKRNVLWAHGSISAARFSAFPAAFHSPLFALICDAAHRSMLQFFMGRAQAKIMFSYSRVRNLKGAKVNNVRWRGADGEGGGVCQVPE